MPLTPEGELDATLSDYALGARGLPVGLAVSGGGDSTALLHLAAERRARIDTPLLAATVDHGLREGSAGEALGVARACAQLGIPHETLRWTGWDGRGNLQDKAREARRRLLAEWARRHRAHVVLLAHTADDQAETVLLRLARGSGVDGLAGMGPSFEAEGVEWARPFLSLTREALRDWLRARGIPWVEDPSNEDPRFDRARARAMMGHLADLGLSRERLLRAADHQRRARATLREAAVAWAGRHARAEGGDAVLDRLPQPGSWRGGDTEWRVLAGVVQWVGGAARHPPRWDGLVGVVEALRDGRAATLGGCVVSPEGGGARVTRELRAAAGPTEAQAAGGFWAMWDRWVVSHGSYWDKGVPAPGGEARVAALGEEGLAQCPGWRDAGLPRLSLLATPGVWAGGRLLAAPVAGRAEGWRAVVSWDLARFLRMRWGMGGG